MEQAQLNAERLRTIQKTAQKTARSYRRRVWWVEQEELEQVALLAQIQAEPGFDPQVLGARFEAYTSRVALYAVSHAVHKLSAPVSASHNYKRLAGLYRETLESTHAESEELQEHPEVSALNAQQRPDRAYAHAALVHAVRERCRHLLGPSGTAFALAIVSGKNTPDEIATAHGVPVQQVYALRGKIRGILLDDARLYRLWKEHE